MKFENLRKEDRELIKRSMLNHSVSLTSEALECKETMLKETYEKTMRDADRLIFLVNVLNDRKNYD